MIKAADHYVIHHALTETKENGKDLSVKVECTLCGDVGAKTFSLYYFTNNDIQIWVDAVTFQHERNCPIATDKDQIQFIKPPEENSQTQLSDLLKGTFDIDFVKGDGVRATLDGVVFRKDSSLDILALVGITGNLYNWDNITHMKRVC